MLCDNEFSYEITNEECGADGDVFPQGIENARAHRDVEPALAIKLEKATEPHLNEGPDVKEETVTVDLPWPVVAAPQTSKYEIMSSLERSAQPSAAQIESLLNFLEGHRSLAKGYHKTQGAKEQARRHWEQLAVRLNSMGGTVKTSKQWTKYWSDKKSTTRKKVAARAAARRKPGGGEDVLDLSEVEARIVALLGGEGFSTGDTHLGIQLFQESVITQPRSPGAEENLSAVVLEPEQLDDELSVVLPRRTLTARRLAVSAEEEPPVATSQGIFRPSSHFQDFIAQPLSCTSPVLSPPRPPPTQSPPPPIAFPRPNLRSTRIGPTPRTVPPSRRGTTSEVSRPSTLRGRAHRGRSHRIRPRLTPPSQHRTELSRITDRFLRLEEQQLEIQRSHARFLEVMLEQCAERDRSLVQAVTAMGEGLKALAESIKRD